MTLTPKTLVPGLAALMVISTVGFAHDGHDHGAAGGSPSGGQAQAGKADADGLLAAAQKICPVTGADLNAMGGPYRAKSGDRTIFLCCKSCLGKPIKPDAWQQVQKNLAAAQGLCPVMKNPLPANPASVVVEGRTVFVCCKPCIEKVKADPGKAVAFVDAQLRKHADAERKAEK